MYFNVNFNVFFKIKKLHLLVSELYITLYCLLYSHIGVRPCRMVAHNTVHRQDYFIHVVTAPHWTTASALSRLHDHTQTSHNV